MSQSFYARVADTLAEIEADGLYKTERLVEGPQGSVITVGGREVLNFCANNYLGLAGDPRLAEAAVRAIDRKSTRLNSSHNSPSRMPSSA